MKRSAAFPSNYLKKEDFETPQTLTISHAQIEKLNTDDGGTEEKVTLYFQGQEKGLILNNTNWMAVADIRGEDPDLTDTDAWPGLQVEVYNDPTVMFGKQRVGGIRVRPPSAAGQVPVQANPTTQLKPGLSDESKAKLGAVLELHSGRLGVDMGEMRKFALDHFHLTTVTETNVEPLIAFFGVVERAEDGELTYPGDQVEVPF